MKRRIISSRLDAAGTGNDVDSYVDRIVKYIPTEIVGAWIAVKGIIIASGASAKEMLSWICFAAAAILTLLYILKRAAIPGKPPAVLQALLSTGAFVVWCFALGEPFTTWLGGQQQSLYGSLLLIFYTLVIGLIVPKS